MGIPSILRTNVEKLLLIAMLCVWSLAWDYNHYGSFQRGGRIKVLLIAAAALAALRFAKTWHWTVGLFYFYVVGSWLHFGFSPWVLPINGKSYAFTVDAVDEVACITAALFLIPILAKNVARRAFENTIIATSFIHCVIGVLNLGGIYPFIDIKLQPQVDLPIGLLGQQTLLGPFLAFAFGVSALRLLSSRGRGEWALYGSLALLNLGVAIMTKSSMTYASLAAAVGVISVFHLGMLPALLAGAAAVVAVVVADHFDSNILWHSGRLEPWRDAYSLHLLRPWFGFGVGSWEPLSQIIKEVRGYQYAWTYLHCDPLQWLLQLGRVGMGIVALAGGFLMARIHLLYLFRDRENLVWVVGLVVFGVNSLANFTMHLVPHGPIFALCVYQIFILGRREGLEDRS